jgi:hypothetical protein
MLVIASFRAILTDPGQIPEDPVWNLVSDDDEAGSVSISVPSRDH